MTVQLTGTNSDNSGGKKNQPEMSAGKNKVGSAVSYFLLPGIIPEIKELTRGKFGYLAYLIAMIYQIVRILPQGHPYTKPDNVGKFGIRQVIAAAANNIKLDRKNIDQIIIFIAILAGLLLLVFQVLSFLMFLFTGDAWAAAGPVPDNAGSMFITANQQDDIAFFMIREVFGHPTMFGNLDPAGSAGGGVGTDGRTGLHMALHQLITFYNIAILVVAVVIFLYYILVVIGETAQSGIPFGQRFSHVYAPFRLVIAIGLLVPLSYGFNGSQYMALYAAKLGSSFATFGWLRFNETLQEGSAETNNPLGVNNATLVAEPNAPDMSGIVEVMSVVVACREAYILQDGVTIVPYFVNNNNDPIDVNADSYLTFQNEARASAKKGHVSIYFGDPNPALADENKPGRRVPFCGEVKIPIQETDQTTLNATGEASPERIQESYYKLVWFLWRSNNLKFIGERIAYAHYTGLDPCDVLPPPTLVIPGELGGDPPNPGDCAKSYMPPFEYGKDTISLSNQVVKADVGNIFGELRENINYEMKQEILDTGWGGAGIWYNKIAQANGSFVTTVGNIPNVAKRPIVMEKILKEKLEADGSVIDCKAYEANIADNKKMDAGGAANEYYARVLNEAHGYWKCDRSGTTGNIFWDSIGAIFGLNGLFDIRKTVDVVGADGGTIQTTIHPLAKLSSVGKSLVDASVQNMGLAVGMSFGGGMLGVLNQHLGSGLEAFSQMFVSIATIGLSVGFILYYILPFLPFIYFFFAVGGWVKGLFEAMVGAPLWALAHLRIDGDGLPGKTAMSGYLLIFEIFLRPILTVFGLIGGMAIFTASATILNDLFDLAVNNITDTEITPGDFGGEVEFGRHMIDAFFFTVVYAIILYMMAIASFKMITLVPNNITRWLGQSVSSFNDQAADPTAGLTQYAALGGARIGGQLAGATTKLGQGAGSFVGETVNLGMRR